MPVWAPTYKIRRSNRILTFAVHQNFELLNQCGEACFLLKRLERADFPFMKDDRRVPTITKAASSYTIDPDTGYLRYKLWGRSTDSTDEYPDIGVFTCTVTASGGTAPWESAVDKYSFIAGRTEYTFDIYQDDIDALGNPIEDSVYVIFNTPPMTITNEAIFTFGTINPLVKFEGMQPIRDTEPNYLLSLFKHEQWLSSTSRIRSRPAPNRFLLAFPNIASDFSITDLGLLQETKGSWWTVPPPYSPLIREHDLIVRESTGERFQVTNGTPIYIEDILVSQHMDLAELDPRSVLYQIPIITS